MAFLNTVKGVPLQMPPIKNVLKDAWQSAKQQLPDKQKQQQYEDPTSEYGGSSQVSHGSSQRPHNVHFADSIGDESGQQRPTELNPLNPFRNPNGFGSDEQTTQSGYQYEETGFNQGDNNYQQGGFSARWVKVQLAFSAISSILILDKEVLARLAVTARLLAGKEKPVRREWKFLKFKPHGMSRTQFRECLLSTCRSPSWEAVIGASLQWLESLTSAATLER